MQTKTYFASSVSAAMEVARRELGPEAMLVTSRPAPEDVRAFGRLEVTFAWEPGAAAAPEKPLGQADGGRKRGESELDEIRLEMSELREAFGRQSVGRATVAGGSEAGGVDAETCQKLCETGFEKDMAWQIVAAAAKGADGVAAG